MTDKRAEFLSNAAAFLAALPHSKALGMSLDQFGNGAATISMPYDKRFVGDAATGVLHGGAVSALMDTACGAAVIAHEAGPPRTATISLRIDYMRAAAPGQMIRAVARCHHITRNVAFVRATAFDEDENRPVATATATFTVDGAR